MKCLGVMLDDGLSWREQVQLVRKRCFIGLAKLRRLKNVLPSRTKKQLYNALVLPHLDYCSVKIHPLSCFFLLFNISCTWLLQYMQDSQEDQPQDKS